MDILIDSAQIGTGEYFKDKSNAKNPIVGRCGENIEIIWKTARELKQMMDSLKIDKRVPGSI